ncbi:MAG: hypothetical protein JXL84_06335 [Deltaproteobacteria bacterium]|nr:hypothetical protein [Deltaproteobacteria bacterium]
MANGKVLHAATELRKVKDRRHRQERRALVPMDRRWGPLCGVREERRSRSERRDFRDRRCVSDRRRYLRFRLAYFGYTHLRNHLSKVGEIVDVSQGGLAFKYVADDVPCCGAFELDVYVREYGFIWKGIPHKTVSDIEMERDIPFSSVRMRRRGVVFLDLSPDAREKLESLLGIHDQNCEDAKCGL